jgi:glycosyltransferase involved in cell wall biosynthesis
MMQHPLLTVIVPTRDRPGLLERALQSLQRQTWRPLEAVIVDDASTGSSSDAIANAFTHRGLRVRLHRRDVRGGPAVTRNDGLILAEGDYISFLDDDDTLAPNAIEVAMTWLNEHPAAVACSSWHQVIHSTSRVELFRGPTRCDANVLRWYNPIGIPFGVFSRSTAGNMLRFDPELQACEDWDLWLRLAEIQPIAVLPAPLYAYHQHTSARVSRADGVSASGRSSFLTKHRASMSSGCVAYHAACIALLEGRARTTVLASLFQQGPFAAGQAGALLALQYAAVQGGLRLRDPGLPSRTVTRVMRTLSRVGSH